MWPFEPAKQHAANGEECSGDQSAEQRRSGPALQVLPDRFSRIGLRETASGRTNYGGPFLGWARRKKGRSAFRDRSAAVSGGFGASAGTTSIGFGPTVPYSQQPAAARTCC